MNTRLLVASALIATSLLAIQPALAGGGGYSGSSTYNGHTITVTGGGGAPRVVKDNGRVVLPDPATKFQTRLLGEARFGDTVVHLWRMSDGRIVKFVNKY